MSEANWYNTWLFRSCKIAFVRTLAFRGSGRRDELGSSRFNGVLKALPPVGSRGKDPDVVRGFSVTTHYFSAFNKFVITLGRIQTLNFICMHEHHIVEWSSLLLASKSASIQGIGSAQIAQQSQHPLPQHHWNSGNFVQNCRCNAVFTYVLSSFKIMNRIATVQILTFALNCLCRVKPVLQYPVLSFYFNLSGYSPTYDDWRR
jgi:hypothetical protein